MLGVMFGRNRRRVGRPSWLSMGLAQLINRIPFGQNGIIVAGAILLSVVLFSGWLLYRQYDQTDLMSKGDWLMRQGKAAQAVRYYENLVSSHRTNYDANIALGKAYLEIDEAAKAARTFERAAKLADKNGNKLYSDLAVAQYLIAQGYFEPANERLVKTYKRLSKEERKNNQNLRSTMLLLYQNWGNYLFETDTQENVEISVKLFTRALLFCSNMDDKARIQSKLSLAFEKALSIYDVNNQSAKALKMAESVVKVDKSLNTLLLVAQLHQKAGQTQEALKYYQLAYKIDAQQAINPMINLLEEKVLAYRQSGDNLRADKLGDSVKKLAKQNGITWQEPKMVPTVDTETETKQ